MAELTATEARPTRAYVIHPDLAALNQLREPEHALAEAVALAKELDTAARELRAAGDAIRALRCRFAAAFSDPPLHLAWVNGRGLVWRTRGRNSSAQRIVDLTGQAGIELLGNLLPAAQGMLLSIEAERQELMLRQRLLSYECRQLRRWLTGHQRLAAARRKLQAPDRQSAG